MPPKSSAMDISLLGRVVEPLERDGAAQRPVSDDGDHIARAACAVKPAHEVAGFREPARQRNRSSGVTEHEHVMLAFLGVREPGHRAEQPFVHIGRRTPGEHLVHVALVGDVEDDFVKRRIEHAVQGHGRLHHAEIRSDMPAVQLAVAHQRRANLMAQGGQILGIKRFDIGGARNMLQKTADHTLAPSVCPKFEIVDYARRDD